MDQVDQFISERKWYNAYLILSDMDESLYTEELVDRFLNKMLPAASQVYPLSLTRIVIKITKNFSQRLDALIELEKKIECSTFREKEHADSLTLLKIAITDILFDSGKDVEAQVYEFRGMKLTEEQQKMYDTLALKYFEKCKNYDEAYNCAKRLEESEKMIKYAIHARNVFFLPAFKNEPSLFKAVREGNYEYILKNKTDDHHFILEKTYIIKILELCRNKKEVNIDELTKILKLGKIQILKLLIKAMGLDLIGGKLNGEKNTLELSNSASQTITKADLAEIKMQFEAWKNRVDEVIRVME